MSPALAGRLPDFPWDSLAGAKRIVTAHPDGLVDLSVGTPVDPTPGLIRAAMGDGRAHIDQNPPPFVRVLYIVTAEITESSYSAHRTSPCDELNILPLLIWVTFTRMSYLMHGSQTGFG